MDGEPIKKGGVAALIEGKTRAILTGERVALNILQRLIRHSNLLKGVCEGSGGYSDKDP
jgi:nicotinate-nucleotide pyrophosphorylase (carboxylating)